MGVVREALLGLTARSEGGKHTGSRRDGNITQGKRDPARGCEPKRKEKSECGWDRDGPCGGRVFVSRVRVLPSLYFARQFCAQGRDNAQDDTAVRQMARVGSRSEPWLVQNGFLGRSGFHCLRVRCRQGVFSDNGQMLPRGGATEERHLRRSRTQRSGSRYGSCRLPLTPASSTLASSQVPCSSHSQSETPIDFLSRFLVPGASQYPRYTV